MLPKDYSKLTTTQYKGLVADQGCYICGQPAQIHHSTKHRKAYGTKSSDFDIIPLCFNHHLGQEGIHHIGVKKWESKHGDQDKIVEKVRERVKEELKNYI